MDQKQKQKLFEEFHYHLTKAPKPSEYFNEIDEKSNIFSKVYPFTMLGDLKKIEQSPQHHPEGNVWNHTMQVVDMAAQNRQKSREPDVFMWAALLHDLGKAPTTRLRKGRITAYDHDRVGAEMAVRFLREFTQDTVFIDKVSKLVRWHMQILYVVKDLPFANIEKMAEEVSIDEIALLGLCDRLGRQPMSEEKIQEEHRNIERFLQKCRQFSK